MELEVLGDSSIAEDMGFEVLHGIVDCLWVKGEPISSYKEAVERETGILTEVDSYDWITFLPMADGSGAYNRYFGRLTTGKMKVRGWQLGRETRLSTSIKCSRSCSIYWPRQRAWRSRAL